MADQEDIVQNDAPGNESLLVQCFLDNLDRCICQDQQLLCKLLQLSNESCERIQQSYGGDVAVSFTASSLQKTGVFAAWYACSCS